MKGAAERDWIARPWIACATVPNAGSLMRWGCYPLTAWPATLPPNGY
jgi:hypothetical protein